jgi:hypothetical protein
MQLIEAFRHFMYTNELKNGFPIELYVHLFELGLHLEVPQLMGRITKILPNAITTTNIEQGFKCSFESDQNEGDKMQNLITVFHNHFIDHKNYITIRDGTLRNILNSVKRKEHVPTYFWDDDFDVVIQNVKLKLWKTKEDHDIELVLVDEIHIHCHKSSTFHFTIVCKI